MTNYAYIRISDASKQNIKAQQFSIKAYAETHKILLEPKNVFSYKISGSKSTSEERGWEEMIERLEEGDVMLVSDVSRIGRDSPFDILSLIARVIKKGATMIFCRTNTVFNTQCNNDPGKLFMLLGEAYAAVKFAEERSVKAAESAKRRHTEGLLNGRKKGESVKSKLDEHESEILSLLAKGTNRAEISRIFGIARPTLYKWEKARQEVKMTANELGIYANDLTELKRLVREQERLAG